MQNESMATLTLKNVPEELVQALRRRAARHHRSLNREAIACLERVVRPARVEPAALLASLRETRAALALEPLTLEEIDTAVRGGQA